MIPRIVGRVCRCDEPKDLAGKWFFSLWVTELGAGDIDTVSSRPPDFGPLGPFETAYLAREEMKRAAQLACEAIEKGMTGKVSGKFIDMKTNLTKRWDRADEH